MVGLQELERTVFEASLPERQVRKHSKWAFQRETLLLVEEKS